MMRFIRPVSDLHLFGKPYDLQSLTTDVDTYLITAGDIDILDHAIQWLGPISLRFKKVIYIVGNHEFYHGDLTTVIQKIRDKCVNYPNIVFLDTEVYEDNGVRFIASTLWTDYNGGNSQVMKKVMLALNDYRAIKIDGKILHANDLYQKHLEDKKFLETEISKKYDGTTVVITHHAPSYKSVHPRYKNSIDDEVNYGFVSNLDELVENSGAKYWIHGHVHDSFDYDIGNTRVICNPRGYAIEHGYNGYDEKLVLDV